jgi:quercetin dioxygenase-like cupin family protein
MASHAWDQIPVEQMNPLVTRQVIHSENLTVARLQLKTGAVVPEHHHENEQISMVMEGRIRFTVAGVDTILTAGQILGIPPNLPHSVETLADCVAVDLFSPRREDWIRGDDAYLRGR